MSNEALWAIIGLLCSVIGVLLGLHYRSLVVRLTNVENKNEEMRKDFTASMLTTANAAVVAAQAVATAAQTIVKNGNYK